MYCKFPRKEKQKCYSEITNPHHPPQVVGGGGGGGIDRNILISTTLFFFFFGGSFCMEIYFAIFLREKEACYEDQTWRAYSGSEGAELCQFFGFLRGFLHG